MSRGDAAWEQAASDPVAAPPSFERVAIRLAAIGELAAAVHNALDLTSIHRAVVKHGRWVLDFRACTLVLPGPPGSGYLVYPLPGALPRAVASGAGWAGWVLEQGQTVVAPAGRDPVRFRQDQDNGAVASDAQSAIYLPLGDRQDRAGVLIFSSDRANAFSPDAQPIAHLIRLQVAAAVRNTRLVESLETAEAVVMSLAHAVEAKDAYTEGHCRRLADYGVLVGRALKLPAAELDSVYKGGMLHDIGKIAIPESILLKPGRLTPDEFERMKEHVAAGIRICAPLRSLQASLPVIQHHHEHFNGRGYPDGLAGDAIPLLARIIAIADAYDAMTTTRPYRTAMPPEQAQAILQANAGPQWDPALVSCFLDVVGQQAAA